MAFLQGDFISLGEYQVNFLRDNLGNVNMAIDGEADPTIFCYKVPDGFSFYIDKLMVTMIDNGTFQGDRFGAIAPGGIPDIGVAVFITDPTGTQIKDLLDGETIRRNTDWCSYAGKDVVLINTRGMGVDWDFSSSLGRPIRLTNTFRFCMLIADDISSLVRMTATLSGALVDTAKELEVGLSN